MTPLGRGVALGTSAVTVPRLGLGTAPIGGLFSAVPAEIASATVLEAYRRDVRFFDTAPLYGFGVAERRLGEALAEVSRDSYVLATKVGRLLERRDAASRPLRAGEAAFRGAPPLVPVFDFSAEAVRRSFGESLERLGVDRIDLVHIHDPDDHEDDALEGAFPVLDGLRSEGVIGAIGVGMNQSEMLTRFVERIDIDCVLIAGRYTLLDQSANDALLRTCSERGVSVIVGGVFNSGILADPRVGATYDYRPADAEILARAERIKGVCRDNGVPMRAAAVQFPRGHAAVATVLVGARSPEEVSDAVAMFDHDIPPSLWSDLKAAGLLQADAPTPGDR